MLRSPDYISEEEFQKILDALNLNYTEDQRQDLLERATGDFESDMCERYIVPLVCEAGSPFKDAPPFAKRKVLNAMNLKIRQIVGSDNNRNLIIDSTQKFIDTQKYAYQDCVKVLLDPKKVFGFKFQPQAEGAVEPYQSIGLGRADNELEVRPDRLFY